MWMTIRVLQHERGLWFRHGNFRRLLGPGVYRFVADWLRPGRDRLEVMDTLCTKFEHRLLDVLLAHDEVRDALEVVDLADAERALVWKDERLAYICGPGRHAFWRQPARLAVEVFEVGDGRFEHPRLATIVRHPQVAAFFERVTVSRGSETVLLRDGRLAALLSEGQHVLWKHAADWVARSVDRREQVLDVAGQEIMTADKVSLRVNLVVTFAVTDVVASVTVASDAPQVLYREAQLALRAAVGTRSLDVMLAEKESLGRELAAALGPRAAEFGVTVRSVGLRDVVLPGEMRSLLNKVVEATKEAEANLIRRREETAAARSQANTARLMAENPTLARLKELELLKEVLAGTKATFVLGGGDIAEQVKSLVRTELTPTAGADAGT